jgi:hypothetical protein
MAERLRLDDILDTSRDEFNRQWQEATGTNGGGVLPDGAYDVVLVDGRLFASTKKGTPGIKLKYRVLAPIAHVDRTVTQDLWLTEGARGFTKGQRNKLGLEPAAFETEIPPGILVKIEVAVEQQGEHKQNKVKIISADKRAATASSAPTAQASFSEVEDGEDNIPF